MAKELIINASLPEVRIALLEEGRIQELLIERQSEKGIVGNIYKGKVTRVLPGMQAAFVDIGLDKAAFLYVDDIYVHPQVMGEDAEIEDDSAEGEAEAEEGNAESGSVADESTTQGSAEGESTEAETLGFVAENATDEILDSPESLMEDFADDADESEDSAEEFVAEASEEANGLSAAAEGTVSETTTASTEELSADADSSDEDESDDEGSDEDDSAEDSSVEDGSEDGSPEGVATAEGSAEAGPMAAMAQQARTGRRNRRRRRRGRGGQQDQNKRNQFAGGESHVDPNIIPDTFNEQIAEAGNVQSDRSAVAGEEIGVGSEKGGQPRTQQRQRPEFREQRNRDRRIKAKSIRPRAQANIADLLKEGQEVIVQVAKDPIATKGARLTCHVSLPGRHLVCMPSIDHVGVSRRIERDDERRRLRDFVEKNRPKKMGFIVRTASSGKDPESWIKQDIDYLSKLWKGIRAKADDAAPASLVYEDLNSVLRAIRDWVNEDIQKIVVDSRYHYNELLEFSERFMPSLEGKIELYQGDIPIFDAYGLSAELHRSLERKVWLKSGGSIVIDQAEALVAIDVNTGRFVGKTNLEATILKTNLEAAEEIAYQMRLRNCGGIIIVDFIDMEREDNKMRVYRALDEALKKDRARPTIQKISELGLVEMTRKRTRDTLVRSLCEPCTHCEGKGYTKGARTVAYEILREVERLGVDRDAKKILISAHESVIDLLAIDLRDVLDTLEKRYNKTVYLQAIMDFHNEQFEVVTDRQQGKKQGQDIARQLRIERDRNERKEKQKQRHQRDDRGDREDRQEREGRSERNDREAGREGRGGRDGNRGNRDQRNQQRDQQRGDQQRGDQQRDQQRDQNAAPRGSFVVRPKPVIEPKAESNPDEAIAAQAGNEFPSDDAQFAQHSTPGNVKPTIRPQQAQGSNEDELADEDQLAYLRAQAAQDAAIASLSQDGAGPKSLTQNRGRNQQHQQNRNRGSHGGNGGQNSQNRNQNRNQQNQKNNRNQQQNQKFRPRPGIQQGVPNGNQAGNPVSVAAAPVAQESFSDNVPDYEVIAKNDGDGSAT
jgi:Rne/Rng family ribonuclease